VAVITPATRLAPSDSALRGGAAPSAPPAPPSALPPEPVRPSGSRNGPRRSGLAASSRPRGGVEGKRRGGAAVPPPRPGNRLSRPCRSRIQKG
jgi:hypothetical protein